MTPDYTGHTVPAEILARALAGLEFTYDELGEHGQAAIHRTMFDVREALAAASPPASMAGSGAGEAVSAVVDIWARQRQIVRPGEAVPVMLANALDCLMNAEWLRKNRAAAQPVPSEPPAVDEPDAGRCQHCNAGLVFNANMSLPPVLCPNCDAECFPKSEPPAGEAAEVLRGLVERWRREADAYGDHTWSRGLMAQIKRDCADELQAATGARAAGGADNPAPDRPPLGFWSLPEPSTAREESTAPTTSKLLPAAPSSAATDEAAKKLVEWLGCDWDDYSGDDRDNAREAVRIVLAAQPAPSAHGVAELLAECEKRTREAPEWIVPAFSCDEIVRLLAPAGPDGTEAGT